jgi:hypothetical protein
MAQQAIIIFHFMIPARVDKKDSHPEFSANGRKGHPPDMG